MIFGFFGILIGANIYLAKRFAFFLEADKTTWFYVIFVLLTFFMIGGTMSLINSTSFVGHILFGAAAILLGFTLYLLLSTLAVDLVGLFLKIKPFTMGLVSVFLALSISVYGMWKVTDLKVFEIIIPMNGLTKPIKAVHLTDTHLGHFRGARTLEKIVNIINEQNPDVVFFTGDLLDSKFQLKPESMNPLKNLLAPVYFVEGNHDEYTGINAIKAHLRSIGVKVMENEIAEWGELQIIGLTYMLPDENSVSPHADPNGPNIKKVLSEMEIKKEKPTVLLHHGPDGIAYANDHGVDLYLAGHTHGGQMWPATYVSNAIFEYNMGLHDYNGTKIYVCQGTGTFGPPMRVGTESELTIINLTPIKK